MTEAAPSSSRPRILKATIVALLLALAVLFIAILPAEYGVDPLGVGRRLGLTALSGTEEPSVPPSSPAAAPPAAHAAPFAEDVYKVELRPFEGVEYKYRMEQGATLVYSWAATGTVGFEFHGEPDGAPEKYFDSYAKGEAADARGGFTAAKPAFTAGSGKTRARRASPSRSARPASTRSRPSIATVSASSGRFRSGSNALLDTLLR